MKLGRAWVAAHGDRDAAAIQAITDPDASILEFGFWRRTPDEYEGLFQWMEALDWDWTLDECSEIEVRTTRLACSYTIENEWTRAQELGSYQGRVELLVEDDLITEVVVELDPSWGDVVRHWFDWLRSNHPDDIMVLFRFDEDENLTGGPATSPEAIELYELRVPEYVAAVTAERAATDDG